MGKGKKLFPAFQISTPDFLKFFQVLWARFSFFFFPWPTAKRTTFSNQKNCLEKVSFTCFPQPLLSAVGEGKDTCFVFALQACGQLFSNYFLELFPVRPLCATTFCRTNVPGYRFFDAPAFRLLRVPPAPFRPAYPLFPFGCAKVIIPFYFPNPHP